jgi:putative PIN family toxin of toxin-antitoxin system
VIIAVVDTNVLVSRYLSQTGVPARVLGRWREKAFDLVVSEKILAEYRRVLAYNHLRRLHHFTDDEITVLLDNLRGNARMVETTQLLHVVTDDPEDDKFVEAAVVGGAEFIVSGDRHLLQLRSHQGVRVLMPATFLAVLDAEARV